MEVWFSPNMPGHAQPPAKTVKHPPSPPPDMDRLFSMMRKAHRSIFRVPTTPAESPPPPNDPAELDWKMHPEIAGLPASARMPPPRSEAVFPTILTLEKVGLPLMT